MLKSSLLELILSTAGAKGRKYREMLSDVVFMTYAQLAKTRNMHETQRLCIKNSPRSENARIGLATQNAQSAAPVLQKQPKAKYMHN